MHPAPSLSKAAREEAAHSSRIDRLIDLFEHSSCDCF
jgi:hypothetical protein